MNIFSMRAERRRTSLAWMLAEPVCLIVCLSLFALFQAGAAESRTRVNALSLTYADAWNQTQRRPEIAAFNSWVNRFVAETDPTMRAQMVSEGVSLASQRRVVLAGLIKTNPQQALALTVPAPTKALLPAEVSAELETRVSGMGDLAVRIVCFRPAGAAGESDSIQRVVTMDGQDYKAFTFGRRSGQTSKIGVPLQGIVLDGVIALHDASLRQLDPNEVPAAGAEIIDLRTSAQQTRGNSASPLAEAGGKLYRFGSSEELQNAEAELEAAEAGFNPNPTRTIGDILVQSGTARGRGVRNAPTPWTTGNKAILYIRIDFSDLAGDPIDGTTGNPCTQAFCKSLADNLVTPYYAKSSYGLTSLSNVVTSQLYRMPRTAASYATAADNFGLHADAEAAAAANYNLANYDRIVVVFSNLSSLPGSFINYGGLADLGNKKVWVNGEFDFRVLAHELGHTYGLLHAGLWQVPDNDPISPFGTVIEYGDDFDTMGANYADDLNTDFNPYYKNMLGWLSDSQVVTVTTNGGTFRVYAFDLDSSAGAHTNQILALKFIKDAQTAYWIGVRRDAFTNNTYIKNGAYIMWGFTTAGAGGGGGYQSALLDMTTPGQSPPTPPAPNGASSDFDAALAVGSQFIDPVFPFAVRPVRNGGFNPNEYMEIEINGGGVTVITNFVTGGNGNGVIDVNECNELYLAVTNLGLVSASQVKVTLSTTVPGVAFGVRNSGYVDMAPGEGGLNLVPFTISTAPFFACGTPIPVTAYIKTAEAAVTNFFVLGTGSVGTAARFDSPGSVGIPDNSAAGVDSLITVSNVALTVAKVAVSVHITHTYDSDLKLELIGPDGTRVPLCVNRGGGGNNFGSACVPDGSRTTFDDGAALGIAAGSSPFLGSFQPETPLAVFSGKSGTNINGVWKLHVVDREAPDAGTLQCWSLFLSPTACVDGGGTCPGADLALGLKALPEPVFLGSNLVYTISVTNFAPGEAKDTVVSQLLPLTVIPVNVVSSQGSCNFAGNTMIANLGTMAFGAVATVTVTVTPAVAGAAVSSASVTSSESDPDPSNNSANVTSHINPAQSDMAVGLTDSPDPVLVGGVVTYTVSVTNLGPSASSVSAVTVTLSPGMSINNAVASQGNAFINGNVVTGNLVNLAPGGKATVTITAVANVVGVASATAVASAAQSDPIGGNNTAVATTTVGPAANLGITLVDTPDPAVVRSNWTYFMVVTNAGPSAASGVVVNQTLPANVAVVSTNASQGTISVSVGTVTANLGTLAAGASASVTVTVNATNSGLYSSTATVTGGQADSDNSNNSASATTTVSPPNVSIVAAGATLTAESVSPPNGALDAGETVTISLRLRNAGNVSNTNLMATLLATGGVTSPSPATPVSFGLLPPGGLPTGQPYSFTVSGAAGATVTATLQLTDGASTLPSVTYTFTLPVVKTFANTNFISITDNQPLPWAAGPATPYPSTNFVSGVAGLVGKVTVTLSNLNHTFPDDIDALLVGPGGQKVLLMSDAGGAGALNNVNLTIDDGAASQLPDGAQIVTTSYRPADYEAGDSFNAPAPAGPYGTALSSFAGLNPNGTWALYIMDDSTGDPGNVAKGWSLTFTQVTPVNQIADLGLSVVSAPSPALLAGNLTCTFTATNAGPNPATGVGFTNVIPVGATLVSATASQGVANTNGNIATASLGTINAGALATVTVVVRPVATGALVIPASVGSSESDLNLANNTASVNATVNLPAADVGVTQVATNAAAGNVALVITATNAGPQIALNVVVSNSLPAGLNFVSTSAGTFTNSGGNLTIGVGDLAANASSTFIITVNGAGAGVRTNTVKVGTVSSDSNTNNNWATVLISPQVVAAGAVLTAEALPANGTVDPGETVTVSLSLSNVGTADPVNLVATLQSGGGVTPITTSRSYGALTHGGAAAAQPFTFTASGPNGGVVTATLQITDGANALGNVSFAFNLPTTATFSNSAAISIPDHGAATPYPSTIEVSGMTGLVSSASVKLYGFSHGFPDDVDVLLVGPTGRKLVLLSDAGGGHSVSNLTLTFTDAGGLLPDSATLVTANYAPADYEVGETFPAPAPGGASGNTLSSYNGSNPNGTWSLYVVDDATGDAGLIGSGWSLTLTALNTVNSVADLAITMTDAPDPVLVGNGLTYTIGAANNGPQTATGVTVMDALPAGLTFINATTSQGSVTNIGNLVTANIGNLANGATVNLTIRVTSATGGNVNNTATINGGQTDLNSADNSVQVSTLISIPVVATLTEAVINSGHLEFTLTGQPNTSYLIQTSANLSSWTTISTQTTAPNGLLKFTDPAAPTSSQKYYRAVRVLE